MPDPRKTKNLFTTGDAEGRATEGDKSVNWGETLQNLFTTDKEPSLSSARVDQGAGATVGITRKKKGDLFESSAYQLLLL